LACIESAELGNLDIMHKFAEFLLPDLDTSKYPPQAVVALVKASSFGLKSGKGIYDGVRATARPGSPPAPTACSADRPGQGEGLRRFSGPYFLRATKKGRKFSSGL
jgi:3-hydroxyacyl-CoA dehydrogenase